MKGQRSSQHYMLLLSAFTAQVHVVETEDELSSALYDLNESMRDDLIALDLEWDGRSDGPIALMQLASSACVVLVRICSGAGSCRRLCSTFSGADHLGLNAVTVRRLRDV